MDGFDVVLRELRAADPAGLAVIRHLNDDNPADREFLLRYILFPGAVVASDAMPLTWNRASLPAGPAPDPDAWPLPAAAITDQATYSASTRPTTGIRHVLVNGTFVVRDTRLVQDARPGRPVRATP